MALITEAAMRCGFAGGLVVDYPNRCARGRVWGWGQRSPPLPMHSTKAKKFFLTLMAGRDPTFTVPRGLGDAAEASTVAFAGRKSSVRPQRRPPTGPLTMSPQKKKHGVMKDRKPVKYSRDWVLWKKERQRRQGKDVRRDSKYSARRRPDKF